MRYPEFEIATRKQPRITVTILASLHHPSKPKNLKAQTLSAQRSSIYNAPESSETEGAVGTERLFELVA